jgi:hypothetical protein
MSIDDTGKEEFSTDELRQIRVFREALRPAPEDPSAVQMPAEPEPIFSGTYRRRLHWVTIVGVIVLLPCMLILLYVMLTMLGNIVVSMINSAASYLPPEKLIVENQKYQGWESIVNFWIPLVLSGCFALISAWRILPLVVDWFFLRRIVTETTIRIERHISGALLNLVTRKSDIDEWIWRKDVRNVKVYRSGLGKLLGYATVTFETNVQDDGAFHDLAFFAAPDQVLKLFPFAETRKKEKRSFFRRRA